MFLKNNAGALNTTEIIVIILLSLIAGVPAIWSVSQAVAGRFNSMAEQLGG